MLDWIKNIFKSPKAIIRLAVDSLDYLVVPMAHEIEKIRKQFNEKTPMEQAQWAIDRVQEYLIKQWKL